MKCKEIPYQKPGYYVMADINERVLFELHSLPNNPICIMNSI